MRNVPSLLPLLLFVIMAAALSGCIEQRGNEDAVAGSGADPGPDGSPFKPYGDFTGPVLMETAGTDLPLMDTSPAAGRGSTVLPADPIPPFAALTPDYRELEYVSPETCNRGACMGTEFHMKRYELDGTSIGLRADVGEAPFTVWYEVEPGCANTIDCFFIMTIRDPETGGIVLEDGYGGLYSADLSKNLTIRAPGSYHLNLYGEGVDVTLHLLAGSANTPTGVGEQVIPTPTEEESFLWY
ncbi:MAG: hypothetical protein LUQ25_03640 [Methanoregulaceae archaeon]|nr:hypothetical protein [Methanoregulaceae archaeon]